MHFRMNKFMQEGAFKQLFKKQTQGIQEKYNIKKADSTNLLFSFRP